MAHRTTQKKYINLLLIPDDESSTRKLRIRYSYLVLAGILIGLLIVLLLVVALTYGRLLNSSFENVSLKQERTKLLGQVQKVNQLSRELEQLKSMREQVQKNLTGFINLADDQSVTSDDEKFPDFSDQAMASILTSIPVVAPVHGFLSQEFAPPKHNGIDIAASEGTPIVSAAKGKVLYSDWCLDGGYTIIIGHHDGYYTYYKHNQKNVVQTNQQVAQGELIGYLGNSGLKSDGPHLHFEIWKDGVPIDPQGFIQNLKPAGNN